MMWNLLEIDLDLELEFRNHHRMIELDHSLHCEVLRGIAAGWDYNLTMLVWLLVAVQLIRDRHNRILEFLQINDVNDKWSGFRYTTKADAFSSMVKFCY